MIRYKDRDRIGEWLSTPEERFFIESHNPGDGRRYRIMIEVGEGWKNVSPSLEWAEFAAWVDGFMKGRER